MSCTLCLQLWTIDKLLFCSLPRVSFDNFAHLWRLEPQSRVPSTSRRARKYYIAVFTIHTHHELRPEFGLLPVMHLHKLFVRPKRSF